MWYQDQARNYSGFYLNRRILPQWHGYIIVKASLTGGVIGIPSKLFKKTNKCVISDFGTKDMRGSCRAV